MQELYGHLKMTILRSEEDENSFMKLTLGHSKYNSFVPSLRKKQFSFTLWILIVNYCQTLFNGLG
jgi:hypothetical protein